MSAFVLAAGGTGGHLFPASALAGELVRRGYRAELWTDRRTDGFAADLPGVAVCRIRAGQLGGGPVRAAFGFAELAIGTIQARRHLRRLQPAAVVGFGGYSSVPTMLAAVQVGVPAMIHEQNAVLGRANRLLAARVQRIATGFAETEGLRPADRPRAVHTGNPVRPAILALAGAPYQPPAAGAAFELLILGGSQGASIFAEIVPAALALLPPPLRAALRVSQQARLEDRAAVAAELSRLGIAAEVESFFTDVPSRLARAHLVICRAGASTIAELAAAGRPALLVPYPYAADDHQSANAHAFAKAGGGWVLPQSSLDAPLLAERLSQFFAVAERLSEAASAARRFARDDAAGDLASLVLALSPGLDDGRSDAATERAA